MPIDNTPKPCRCVSCGKESEEVPGSPHCIMVDPSGNGELEPDYCGWFEETKLSCLR